MQLDSAEIGAVSGLVLDLCGVVLDETKGYLVESRLGKIAEKAGCKSYGDLIQRIRYGNDLVLRSQVVDAITTHETLFFRDGSPFQALQHKALPELIDAKSHTPYPTRLRIWSAACSTGQEPYSLAIVLRELIPDIDRWDVQILATDISDEAVKKASTGHFSELEMTRGMKPEMLSRYFNRDGDGWRVKDQVRSLVQFQRMNLLEPFTHIGPFDVIMCRNVAIYFSPEKRADLFRRLTNVLQPFGYLFAGSSESLQDLGPEFAPQHHCSSVFYQPRRLATARTA